MDWGTDFLLQDDDIVFTADGDIRLVSEAAMVAQDIAQSLRVIKGSLYWDKETGSTMPLFLNDNNSDAASVIAELERIAMDDIRVDPDSVAAYQKADGLFALEFTPIGEVQPEMLEYDLRKTKE
ncbi:hypothetical protein ACFGOO_03175 [Treponema vincentii]|uniref:hypothetical protein n=1 Tax=Treponema vincentii TaxID=69710 RepID=UPI0035F54F42